jgi:hypothetical protein
MHIAAPHALRRQVLPALTGSPSPSRSRFLSIGRASPVLSALLLGCALAGCGGSESSPQATNAAAGSKAVKAEEAPSGSSLNSLDTIVGDMRELNDFKLRGYENEAYGWYVGPGSTHMGNNATFRNSPHWSTFGNDSSYTGTTAQAMLPWLAVFDGVNHNASNVAVEFRNMRTYYKSKSSGEWRLLGGPAKATGTVYGKAGSGIGPRGDTVVNSTETTSTIRMGDDSRTYWHGWWDIGVKSIEPWDIDAFFVTIQARLVVADPSGGDQRGQAELGLQVGADYYLETTTDYASIAPNIGISRTKKLTGDWQAFNYATLSDVGTQIPGGGITEAALRGGPPPLE